MSTKKTNQEYNGVIAEYHFECSSPKVKEVAKSGKCKILEKGVRLHFSRYTLFPVDNLDDTAIDFDRVSLDKKKYTISEVKVNKEELPNTKEFFKTRTFLRAGYIYIIGASGKVKGDYHEYEVNDSGKLSKVLWTRDDMGDIRKSSGGTQLSIPINKLGEYYIAYSPVQWSKKYFDSIKEGSDVDKKKVMQKINCIGVEIGAALPKDVTSYNNVKLVALKGHPQTNELLKYLKTSHSDEVEQTEEADKNNEKSNCYYENMFITLDDPIGCADDICTEVNNKIIDLEALVASLTTGTSPDVLKPSIAKNEQVFDEKKHREHFFLNALAKTTYNFVYNSKDKIDKYNAKHYPIYGIPSFSRLIARLFLQKNGIQLSKIKKSLAVTERKKLREIINEYRNILGDFIESEYLKKY